MHIDTAKLKKHIRELRGPMYAPWCAASVNIGEINGRLITLVVQTKEEANSNTCTPSQVCVTQGKPKFSFWNIFK